MFHKTDKSKLSSINKFKTLFIVIFLFPSCACVCVSMLCFVFVMLFYFSMCSFFLFIYEYVRFCICLMCPLIIGVTYRTYTNIYQGTFWSRRTAIKLTMTTMTSTHAYLFFVSFFVFVFYASFQIALRWLPHKSNRHGDG